MGDLIRRLLSIPEAETAVSRRGFHVRDAAVQVRLESIGLTFLHGYHAALRDAGGAALAERLRAVVPELQGFAFEGAAMALTLLDHLLPVKRGRFDGFLHGDGAPHFYMLHVGAGWALARLPWLRWRVDSFISTLDPLARWLALDGYGFHQGYFYWPDSVGRQKVPRGLAGYARRAFDQGLGRSLWFVEGAGAPQIAAVIAAFPPARRPDLWSGVGLACAYAGGRGRTELELLRDLAGSYRAEVAQGAAFAAQARARAGNPASHTELACDVLCGVSAAAAATVTDSALAGLPPGAAEPAYENWRQRIQEQLIPHLKTAEVSFP
ncbi:MAG: DUF1702 family protein [Bryobacteraceae bacterium]